MEWMQVLTILGGNIGLFLWATRQARSDFLHLDRKLEENRKETQSICKEIHNAIIEMKEEMKDFHHRLCEIEREKIKK